LSDRLLTAASAIVALFVFLIPSNSSNRTAGETIFSPVDRPWYSSHRSGAERTVEALAKSYGPLIDGVERWGDEIVLRVRGRPIFYRDGRMLKEEHLLRASDFTSIFYGYEQGPLAEPGPHRPPQHLATDFLDAAIGDTEHEVRASSEWVSFLGHRVFVQTLCAEPLRRVEDRIGEHALESDEVRDFLSQIRVIYSMKRRVVKGSGNRSYHAYGLAIDIIPASYGGKHVYWLWSSKIVRDWGDIPLSKRWHPPEQVIEAFEENGFIWGGKWYRFDTVHFEYRPEILSLARYRED